MSQPQSAADETDHKPSIATRTAEPCPPLVYTPEFIDDLVSIREKLGTARLDFKTKRYSLEPTATEPDSQPKRLASSFFYPDELYKWDNPEVAWTRLLQKNPSGQAFERLLSDAKAKDSVGADWPDRTCLPRDPDRLRSLIASSWLAEYRSFPGSIPHTEKPPKRISRESAMAYLAHRVRLRSL